MKIAIIIYGVIKMLNYLLDLDLSPDEIYDITYSLSSEVVDTLSLSESVVKESLTYFKSIGVNNISSLIVKRPDLVLLNKNDIEKTLSNMDINKIVEIINNDIEDLILFGV